MKIRLRALALVACTIMMVGACGSSSEPSSAGSSGSSGNSGGPTGEASAGGTLTVGAYGETANFDPATVSSFGTLAQTLVAVYDTLFRTDAEGNTEPYLAESLEPNADHTEWTLKLREGVQFSDGTPLDAEAVRMNFARHQDPEVASNSAVFVEGISEMEVVDDLTLVFRLAEPNVAFDGIFALQPGMIVAPSALAEGHDLASEPIGAGPFVLESWQRDSEMLLTKNPNYWQEGLPLLDEVVFRPIPDNLTRYSSVQTGDVDTAFFVDEQSFAKAEDDGGLAISSRRGNGGPTYVMNTRKPPFDDVRVRQALAHAMDLDAISSVAFEGEMEPTNGPFSPDSPYYVEDNGYPEYDPDLAAQLIEEYESETGEDVEFELVITTAPDRLQLAELLQGMWSDVGAEMSISPIDVSELVARMPQGDFDMVGRTVLDFTDPEPLLSRWYQGDSSGNYSGLVVPELDEAFDTGRTAEDPAEREAAYQDVSRLMAENMPSLWYSNGVTGAIYQPNVDMGDYNGEATVYLAEVGFVE